MTPNEVELFKLANMKAGSSMEEVLQAGKRLLRKGANRLLVTLGGKGALYLGKNEERLFAPPEVPVIDTTAAGDTFNAAFAVKLAEGWNVGKAVDYANCASSVTVSRKGAQASIPTAYQVQEFLFNRKNRAFADKPVMIKPFYENPEQRCSPRFDKQSCFNTNISFGWIQLCLP